MAALATTSPATSITVHRLDLGQPFDINVDALDTVDTLRIKIQDASGVPAESQYLCIGDVPREKENNRHIGGLLRTTCKGTATCAAIRNINCPDYFLLLFDARQPHAFFHFIGQYQLHGSTSPWPLEKSDNIVPVQSGLVPLPCCDDATTSIGSIKTAYAALTGVKKECIITYRGADNNRDDFLLDEKYFAKSLLDPIDPRGWVMFWVKTEPRTSVHVWFRVSLGSINVAEAEDPRVRITLDGPTARSVTVGELKKAFLDRLTTAVAAATKDFSNWDEGWGESFILLYKWSGCRKILSNDRTPNDYCIRLEEVGEVVTFQAASFSVQRRGQTKTTDQSTDGTTEAFLEWIIEAVSVASKVDEATSEMERKEREEERANLGWTGAQQKEENAVQEEKGAKEAKAGVE